MAQEPLNAQPAGSASLSVFAGCAITLAAFIVTAILIYLLIFLASLSGGAFIGDSSYFLVMVGSPLCGIAAAVPAAIIAGVMIYRARQTRPLAFGLLTAAGISILFALVALLLGYVVGRITGTMTALTVPQTQTVAAVNLGAQLLIVLLGIIFGLIGAIFVHRRQIQRQG